MSQYDNAMFDANTIKRFDPIGPWEDYPIGTRAAALGGGQWYKTSVGWKWNGPDGCGSTFPMPGADVQFVLLP